MLLLGLLLLGIALVYAAAALTREVFFLVLIAGGGILLLCLAAFLLSHAAIYRRIRRLTRLTAVLGRGGNIKTEYCEGDEQALMQGIVDMNARVRYNAEALDREKKRMQTLLYDISHQLKTPLSALSMYTEILETREMPHTQQLEFLRLSRTQINRMEWLVQGLLKLARVEYGSSDMKLREAPLAETLHMAAEPLLPLMRKKHLHYQLEAGEEITLIQDPEWLAEAIGNILKNAVEHTPEGGSLGIRAEDSPLTLTLTVWDTGGGIAPEEIPHIFERFYRAKDAGADSVGIGLSLAKRIVGAMDGDIYVRSEPGRGSQFILTFIKNAKRTS